MSETVTLRGARIILNGDAALDTAEISCLVFTGTQTGVHDVDLATVADLDAVSGVSIHSERKALTGLAVTDDTANDRVVAEADDVTFSAAPGVTAQGVAFYLEGASDDSRQLISIHTTNFPQPMDGGLVVQIPNGWLRGEPLVNV